MRVPALADVTKAKVLVEMAGRLDDGPVDRFVVLILGDEGGVDEATAAITNIIERIYGHMWNGMKYMIVWCYKCYRQQVFKLLHDKKDALAWIDNMNNF